MKKAKKEQNNLYDLLLAQPQSLTPVELASGPYSEPNLQLHDHSVKGKGLGHVSTQKFVSVL